MRFELVESRENAGEWRVEAFNDAGDGECYLAIFTGPLAKQRAEEYLLRSKNEAAIRLLKTWMADESGYDETTWPKLKKAIENG